MQVFFNTSFWQAKLCGFWRAAFVFHITRCFLFCWTKLQGNNMQPTNPQKIFGLLSQILTWGPNPSCALLCFHIFWSVLFLSPCYSWWCWSEPRRFLKALFCFSEGNRSIWSRTDWFEGREGCCESVAVHLPSGCSSSSMTTTGPQQGSFDLTLCIHLSVLWKVLCTSCIFSFCVQLFHLWLRKRQHMCLTLSCKYFDLIWLSNLLEIGNGFKLPR